MPPAESITSSANPLLKDVKRAVTRGSLTAQGWWVAETFHLLDEALRSRSEVKVVLAGESAQSAAERRLRGHRDIRLAILPDRLLQSISDTDTSQGVIALVKPPQYEASQMVERLPLIVVLDGLQDPGNAGAIARAAEAFGATGMMFVKGSASPHHPKTLRASAGSLLRIPFLHGLNAIEALGVLRIGKPEIFAAMPAASLAASEANLKAPCVLAIGSEAHGVGEDFRNAATAISIPTTGVESLNAAVAAGILLYEAARQRAGRA